MDEFNPLLLPDLEQAVVLNVKKIQFKKYAHIEYMTKADGSVLRVCRPFGDWPIFYIPIKSLNDEYLRDQDIIKNNILIEWPKMYDYQSSDCERDNNWVNENCFGNVIIEPNK